MFSLGVWKREGGLKAFMNSSTWNLLVFVPSSFACCDDLVVDVRHVVLVALGYTLHFFLGPRRVRSSWCFCPTDVNNNRGRGMNQNVFLLC